MSEILTFSKASSGDLTDVADRLLHDIHNRVVPPEVVLDQRGTVGGAQVILLIFERYYMRNGSYASLTVQLTDDGTAQKATVVGTGGGEGVFNFSLGANRAFASLAAETLTSSGFTKSRGE